uniref:Uncharacterized protein n=1 Tax=Meleagris gallopavo TaxID=9103 RepID=A0A803YCB3_MELGA
MAALSCSNWDLDEQSLDRSQSKRDGGFKNNWSFDHAEESEGDAEKE